MCKKITIVGAGILGLLTATMIQKFLPDAKIEMHDADGDPRYSHGSGTTFGQGRDARHFTGSESLSYQNPIHARALRLAPGEHKEWAGWRLIPEDSLTLNELRWRSESAHRFVAVGHEDLNYYDDQHAQLSYAGIAAWDMLEEYLPDLVCYKISDGPLSIFFLTKKNFQDDLLSETKFLSKFGDSNNRVALLSKSEYNLHFKNLVKNKLLYRNALQLPGSSWRIRSLGLKLLQDLERQGVLFHWYAEIIDHKDLDGDTIIWTAGTTHRQPVIYKKFSLIQGIAGCWVTIPNFGLRKPFKISLPQPIGYINGTPYKNLLHISGGFGWVGERQYHEVEVIMDPIIERFKEQIVRYFGLNPNDIGTGKPYPIGICVRPSSSTGLPAVRTIRIKNKKHILLTGSGKSGSTQAPLLALYALSKINKMSVNLFLRDTRIRNALYELNSLDKMQTFSRSTDYPEVLENDLFGAKCF